MWFFRGRKQDWNEEPKPYATLDYTGYPHIFELILCYASDDTLITIRATSRKARRVADRLLGQHVIVTNENMNPAPPRPSGTAKHGLFRSRQQTVQSLPAPEVQLFLPSGRRLAGVPAEATAASLRQAHTVDYVRSCTLPVPFGGTWCGGQKVVRIAAAPPRACNPRTRLPLKAVSVCGRGLKAETAVYFIDWVPRLLSTYEEVSYTLVFASAATASTHVMNVYLDPTDLRHAFASFRFPDPQEEFAGAQAFVFIFTPARGHGFRAQYGPSDEDPEQVQRREAAAGLEKSIRDPAPKCVRIGALSRIPFLIKHFPDAHYTFVGLECLSDQALGLVDPVLDPPLPHEELAPMSRRERQWELALRFYQNVHAQHIAWHGGAEDVQPPFPKQLRFFSREEYKELVGPDVSALHLQRPVAFGRDGEEA